MAHHTGLSDRVRRFIEADRNGYVVVVPRRPGSHEQVSRMSSVRMHQDDVKDKLRECRTALEALAADYLFVSAAGTGARSVFI